MTWPRFRTRNGLNVRPNYYIRDGRPGAEPLPTDETEYAKRNRYLSGEIDRMVYGWWLSDAFQEAVARDVGIPRDAVDRVMRLMLNANSLPGLGPSFEWKGAP